MSFQIKSYGSTEVGLVRQKNEDAWSQIPEFHFYCVADGMGGHPAGDVAADETVDALCRVCKQKIQEQKWDQIDIEHAKEFLSESIQEVNSVIYAVASSDPKLRGMGTTLCAIYVHPQGVIYAHVGDSRIYRIRDNKLEQLTLDHSLVHELIELGQLKEEDVELFAHKNIITKSIGNDPVIEPTVAVSSFHNGDKYILCTDGISDMLAFEEIEKMVNRTESVEENGQDLISGAMLKGGHDNATVLIVQLIENDA